MKASQQKQAKYFNRQAKARPDFKEGETVRMKPVQGKTWKLGKILEKTGLRSYKVETTDGRYYIRNSKYLKKSDELFVPEYNHSDIQIPEDEQRPEPDNERRDENAMERREDNRIGQPREDAEGNYITRYGRVVVKPKRYIDEI
jgi:hypothetical protein